MLARSRVARWALEGEQAIEEGAIAAECLPQILCCGLLTVEAVFQISALVAEQLLQLVKHLTDQLVGASYGTARLVDELTLQLIPPTVIALCPLSGN